MTAASIAAVKALAAFIAPDQPPFGRRWIMALSGVILGYWWFGMDRGDAGRIRPMFVLLDSVVILLFLGSIILFALSGFRWTWGWWL